jgi:hypothetical protein
MTPYTATGAGEYGYAFGGMAGTMSASVGSVTEGTIPYGFVWMRKWYTSGTAPTASTTNAVLRMGWCTSDESTIPSGNFKALFPFSPPAEFQNSVIPYSSSKCNASAALFSNVSAAVTKEGTVLASRLRTAVVDPWAFGTSDINSTHPSLRYYGPLEKGLYTFTTPSGNEGRFYDHVIDLPGPPESSFTGKRPMFNFYDVGVYNAFIFTDLGSTPGATSLAASCYTHVEFESASSLFVPGMSTLTLEHLHAAEVALLKFGHFHENPLHWAAIKSAAVKALRIVAPMVAPAAKQLAHKAVNAGVEMLVGKKPAGDRKMRQEFTPKTTRGAVRRKPAKTKKRA